MNLSLFLNSVFQHHSGRTYRLILVTNQNTTDHIKFPVTAVYISTEEGIIWSRPAEEFVKNFTLIA